MRIAIYSRQSRLSEVGDSIANQISMCKDYATENFGECEFLVYEDEGFSGGNTDRPMFKQLIKDVNNKKFDVLVCYRLDRISRNVANFSETLEVLNKNNVGFVSIKEQFDTTTPVGKAMMYMSSVFAQLERDTMAERITDNLAALVKSGRYLNSVAPQGYKKRKATTPDGKQYNEIEQDEEEIGRIEMMFEKYLEFQSMKKLETHCLINGLKTPRGYFYKCISLRRILTHPVYATADKHTYEYFENMGCQMCDSVDRWDGTVGVVVYRRTNKTNNPDEWIVVAGNHEPLVSSAKWIKTQEIIAERHKHNIRRPFGKWGMLSGILRCGDCGDYMRPFSRSAHTTHFYYVCSTKEISRRNLCQVKNVRGDILDADIVTEIQSLTQDGSRLIEKLSSKQNDSNKKLEKSKNETSKFKAEIKKNDAAIKKLVMKLAEEDNQSISKHIAAQIKALDERNVFLSKEIVKIESTSESLEVEKLNHEIIAESILKIHNPDFIEKELAVRRNIVKTLIKKITWDGRDVSIEFH